MQSRYQDQYSTTIQVKRTTFDNPDCDIFFQLETTR